MLLSYDILVTDNKDGADEILNVKDLCKLRYFIA